MDTFDLEAPGSVGTVNRAVPVRGVPPPLLTPREHEDCVAELDRLRAIRDRDLPNLLREVRTLVASDAAEESLQIQEDQAVAAARIGRLEDLLRTARVVRDDVAAQVVTLGRSVEVEYVRTGRIATYRIAGVLPASGSGAVSAGSPVGAALMGRSPGEVVAVELPRGQVEDLRILSVLREESAA